ncbi:MAG: hypothetical protein V1897_19765, partial [Pseudomonadota bacterium]
MPDTKNGEFTTESIETMSRVVEFERELHKRAKSTYGRWFRADLHNHGPQSSDYKYKGSDVEEKIAESITRNDLSVVMFTDH